MKTCLFRLLPALVAGLSLLGACTILPPDYAGAPREFSSSFETTADFAAFYTVPDGDWDSHHQLSADQVHDGSMAHKAWIAAARAANNDGLEYRPHRAYPTIQLQKTSGGTYRTPCLVSLWVWLDMALQDKPAGQIDDWMSFITLTPDASDNWSRTVLVNLGHDGYTRLMHVPRQGMQDYLYQVGAGSDPTGSLKFKQKQWVRLDVYIDFSATAGYAKFWQDGVLMSHAKVEGGQGGLAQAHFGLYAGAAVPSGTVYNDKLRIREVAGESEALGLVAAPW